MKTFVKIILISFFTLLFSSCAIYEEFGYDSVHYVYYDYNYVHHHPNHVIIHHSRLPHHKEHMRPHKVVFKYDAKHNHKSNRIEKHPNIKQQDKRKPNNNRRSSTSAKPQRSADRNGRYKR